MSVPDTVYNYNPQEIQEFLNLAPWKRDRDYFQNAHISALALMKMTLHTKSGKNREVMGYLLGKVVNTSFIIMDSIPLPVVSTETRVNAHEDAHEYSVKFIEELSKSRPEKVVGWYHSHPGYGCWLSGIDVNTQQDHQLAQDPFLAIVIDPHKTSSSGKVDIGAFRTYPRGVSMSTSITNQTSLMSMNSMSDTDLQLTPQNSVDTGRSSTSTLTPVTINSDKKCRHQNNLRNIENYFEDELNLNDERKKQDFGVHKDQYYSLNVTFYKNELDGYILDSIMNSEEFKNDSNAGNSKQVENDNEQEADGPSILQQNNEKLNRLHKITTQLYDNDRKFKTQKDLDLKKLVNEKKLNENFVNRLKMKMLRSEALREGSLDQVFKGKI